MSIYDVNVARHEILTAAAERALLAQVVAGDMAARDELIRCNQRLIVDQARRYLGHGLGLDDLVQEGNLGLLRAIEKFDCGKTGRLSTYAVLWVRQFIARACDRQSGAVYLPSHVAERIARLRRAEARLAAGGERDDEALCEVLGWSAETLAETRRADGLRLVTSIDVRRYHNDVDSDNLAAYLAAPDDTAAAVAERDMAQQVRALLASLTPVQRRVVIARHGLAGKPPQTLEAIGASMGVTRERARQIERDALAALRDDPQARALIAAVVGDAPAQVAA